ncbi:hypothetical protein HDU81_006607 [Chytriomyces hyalinus]|nr:hypothetical protein HDU81_006607 [Chytriomyces hyalinus]
MSMPSRAFIRNSFLAALVGVGLFFVNRTDVEPVSTLTTSVIVNAPIEQVWSAVIDFDSWAEWNRYERFIGFEVPLTGPVPAQSGYIKISETGEEPFLTFPLELHEVSHERKYMQWSGGVPVVLYALHSWQLTALEDGTTQVVDTEHFWRLAAHVGLRGKDNSMHAGMLNGLKHYVESNYVREKSE